MATRSRKCKGGSASSFYSGNKNLLLTHNLLVLYMAVEVLPQSTSVMIEVLLTSSLSLAIGAGILVTALLGLLCSQFLELTVTSKIPDEFETWRLAQKAGGGADLGLL